MPLPATAIAISRPSGDHTGAARTPRQPLSGFPHGVASRTPQGARYAIVRPSGDHAGHEPGVATSFRCAPSRPMAETTDPAPSRVAYAIRVPSADHVGARSSPSV